ncbi:hypothetical protein [Methylobacterium tarhaniae]|uniref:hypothetical protein n=1 Tax=Methylobacterium tarhaniae TaxID=1187852 RepID=UPI00069E5CFE|nr:hypothetical protein [Methylobacterium tarhaniae]
MPTITVPCATCAGTGWATHEDRHTETRQDQCRTCGGTGQVPARPGEARETSWPCAVPDAARAQLEGDAARRSSAAPELVRHIRSGRLYEVLFRGARVRTIEPLTDYDLVMVYRCSRTGQVTLSSQKTAPAGTTLLYVAAVQTGAPLSDGAEVVVYRALDGNLAWARSTAEMEDGRFEAVPGARQAGTVSILEERIKAGIRYFRDGAAVRTGVLPDHASHIADVLQSLLSELVTPRAAEPADDAVVQARRLAADLAEERFRGDLAALFLSGSGDDHPWVQMALRGLQAAPSASYQDRSAAWMGIAFADDPTDDAERRDRPVEEVCEGYQADGGTLDDWIAIGRYVFGRPAGRLPKEFGQMVFTLALWAAHRGVDMMAEAQRELARCSTPEFLDKLARKRTTRHGRGPLPGLSGPGTSEVGEA